MTSAVGSRVTGIQAGLILAYLSGRVLGQYELFLPPETSPVDGQQPGRLTLVAPNIVMIERELGVDPHDFRRWVCLHEETHRLQFTAVPWLRDYVQSQMTEFLLASELDPAAILQRLRAAADANRVLVFTLRYRSNLDPQRKNFCDPNASDSALAGRCIGL